LIFEKKNENIGLMWVEGELLLFMYLVRGCIHNDDGSIWDIYDVEK
jgi:hypothetical protein